LFDHIIFQDQWLRTANCNGHVFFKYKKNIPLNIIALLVLPLSFILGFIQPKKHP